MFSATDLDDMLRSMKDPVFKANLAESIKKAGSCLVDMGLLAQVKQSGQEVASQDAAGSRRLKKKRRTSNETTPGSQDWQFTKKS